MVVRITGGLGNQMFQYAFGKALEQTMRIRSLQLDISSCLLQDEHNGYELERLFQIQERYYRLPIPLPPFCMKVFTLLEQRLRINLLHYGNCITDADLISLPPSDWPNLETRYLSGYWQSERYFAEAADCIRSIFTFPPIQESKNLEVLRRIESTQSVSVHIRRADYLRYSHFQHLDQTDYYQRAIAEIQKRVNNPVFYVFSDDIPWCKENLPLPEGTTFVDWNRGDASYRDMQLMSLCRHNIIANSTFSWWGAWLNSSPHKIVIAPEQVFVPGYNCDDSNFIPSTWITLPVDGKE